jgi:excisionase family DNA binding protein
MSPILKQPVVPSDEDVKLAKQSSRSLTPFAGSRLKCTIKAKGGRPIELELPAAAVRILSSMLAQMANGNAVVLMPVNSHLTTQQAADLLGVSRPFLVAQMKSGKLRFQKIGTHRRIAYADLMEYRKKIAAESDAAMDALVSEAQKLGLGYE